MNINPKFKKILKVAAITACSLPVLYGGSAFAADVDLDLAPGAIADISGDTYINTNGDSAGAKIVVTLSPGVVLCYYATANSYAIKGMNGSVNVEVRNEYGVATDYEGFYMRLTPLAANDDPMTAIAIANAEAFTGDTTNPWSAQ